MYSVELPIKAKRNNLKLITSKSNERARIGGVKKPNAFKDGLRILLGMIKLFLKFLKVITFSNFMNDKISN